VRISELLQENALIPKKVLGIVLVRFFKDLHFALHDFMKDKVEGFDNELNVDTSEPEMRLFLDFPGRNLSPPRPELKKIMNDLAKKHKISHLKPTMTFDKESSFGWWVVIKLDSSPELDDAALDAAWEEVKRLGLNKDVTTDGLTNSLTVNG
jgi:hypothetical protein